MSASIGIVSSAMMKLIRGLTPTLEGLQMVIGFLI